MSYELQNTLAGFGRWFTGGGWIVLLVVAALLVALAYVITRSNR